MVVSYCLRKIRFRNSDYFSSQGDKEGRASIYRRKEMKGRKNPYAKHLKKQVTLRLGIDVIEYFKGLAEETGIPYQNLINLYLRECAHSRKKLTLNWAS